MRYLEVSYYYGEIGRVSDQILPDPTP